MLKRRVIPSLLLKDDRLWKSRQFDALRDVGFPTTAVRVYESQEADELVLLNIDARRKGFDDLVRWSHQISASCAMPLVAGGGIRTLQDVRNLFENGADKVLLNTMNYESLDLLEETSKIYGVQSVVVGIDVRMDGDEYVLYSHGGEKVQERSLQEHIQLCEKSGAGEFYIQSIDRDGMMDSLDIDLGKRATGYTKRPVVLAGGAGSYAHLRDAFSETIISGVGCASIFHFSDSSPLRASAYLANAGIPVKRV